MNTVSHHNSKKKVVALSAAGLVLVAGATVTSLAAWTDTEWIFGGADANDPGVGTSEFEVQQNVTLDSGVAAADAANWVDRETSPGQQIDFGVEANSLTPGDTVYAFVRLRTVADSDAGRLTLNPAVPNTEPDPVVPNGGTDEALFEALDYEARIVTSPTNCNEAGFAGPGTSLVPAGSPLATAGTSFDLVADGAEVANNAGEKTVCFALTLPANEPDIDTLQGLSTTPVWNFTAISQ